MSKKHFIALVDAVRSYNRFADRESKPRFGPAHLELLADFCQQQNAHFMRERWIDYVAGVCGPNGGERKAA